MGNRAGFAPGEAREDWAILRALSESLGKTLPFDSLAQLRAQLYETHPHFAEIDEIMEGDNAGVKGLASRKGGSMRKAALTSSVEDFI